MTGGKPWKRKGLFVFCCLSSTLSDYSFVGCFVCFFFFVVCPALYLIILPRKLVRVNKIIVHQNFSTHSHDIALLKLGKFSHFFYPWRINRLQKSAWTFPSFLLCVFHKLETSFHSTLRPLCMVGVPCKYPSFDPLDYTNMKWKNEIFSFLGWGKTDNTHTADILQEAEVVYFQLKLLLRKN